MDEAALERFFDQFITHDSSQVEEGEELSEEEEEFLRLLPDELLTLCRPSQDDTAEGGGTADVNYSSQNSTGRAEAPGASSPPPEPWDPSECPAPPLIPAAPFPQIQNIISSVRLGCRLDLDFIARTAWNVEYNPKAFSAVTMRIREPRATALIFKSGTLICTGVKSEHQSKVASRRFARKLQKLGFPVSFLGFKIQNVVAKCRISPISLKQLAQQQHCSYEPELFPGLFYSVTPNVTVSVYATGMMVFTGAKTEAEIYRAFESIYPIVSGFTRP